MIGYQNPFGKVMVLVGENLQEVQMLKKGALVEYLKKKKFSQSTYERLEKQIQSEEKPKKESPKKEVDQTSGKKEKIPSQLLISKVPNSAGYLYGQIVTFQNGHQYQKGRKYWNLVK